MIPALEPFKRRNIHHYDKHDPNGRLIPSIQTSRAKKVMKAEEEDSVVPIEDAEHLVDSERRQVNPSAEEVMNMYHPVNPEEEKLALVLPKSFKTSGVVKSYHSITGVDKYHHFDVNDYFGSSVTKIGHDAKGLTTLAVGAPGALENSGMIYFLTLQKDGQVESYSYLTNADDSLGEFWTSNVALGWTVENIGDLDGMYVCGCSRGSM